MSLSRAKLPRLIHKLEPDMLQLQRERTAADAALMAAKKAKKRAKKLTK